MITKLKIVAATVVIVGIIIGYLDITKYAPHSLLLESSPDRPRWLPSWLGWAVTSASAILYILLDYLNE